MRHSHKLAKRVLLTSTLTGIIVAGYAVTAQGEEYANYIQLKAGIMQPTSGYDDAGYDTGFGDAISFGRYLTDYLILEGTMDGSVSTSESNGSTTTTGNYTQKNEMAVLAMLLTLKAETSIGDLNLYGGGGIGAYFVNLDGKIESDRYGTFKNDDNDNLFGVHLVAGANYDITDWMYLGVEGTYRWTQSVDINKTAVSVPITYDDNLNDFTLSAALGFRF